MQLTKGAIGNLINRYKAVLKKCHLMNTFGSLAVAGMLVMGGAAAAGAAIQHTSGVHNYPEENISYTVTGDAITADGTDKRNNPQINIGNSDTQSIAITADGGIFSLKSGHITLTSKEVTLISKDTSGSYSALWAQNNSTDINGIPVEERASITINAENTNIKAANNAIVAMSNGIIEINGNLHVEAQNALVARGDAIISLNKSGESTVGIDGNINFNYDDPTSGTGVNATIDITLNGADSYWNGNTLISWNGKPNDPSKLDVSEMTLTVKDGATWTPTAISTSDSQEYTALNKLTLDGGIVDVHKGVKITIENINGKGDIINAGSVTIEKGSIEGPITFEKGNATADNMVTVDKDGITTLTGGVAGSGTIDKLAIDKDGKTTITNAKLSGHEGRALKNEGTLTINGGSFEGNKANVAGAIYNAADATLMVDGVTFANNSSVNNVAGAINNRDGKVIITNSTFKGNDSGTKAGGAIANTAGSTEEGKLGTITIKGSTFEGNKAGNGGAVWNGSDGKVEIADSTFKGNTAVAEGGLGQGGAITNADQMTITGSTFEGNQAGKIGGAIFNAASGKLDFKGTNTFTGNTAAEGKDIYNEGTLTMTGDSHLIVDGNQNIYNASSATLTVNSGAKLTITDAVAGGEYEVVTGEGKLDIKTGAWSGDNLQASSDMVALSSNSDGTFTAEGRDAHTVFPNLSEGMTNAVNDLYAPHKGADGKPWNYADVNSDQMGVRFLSRATDNTYLGADKNAAAATIESAARIAFAGAVPQMTKMASDAGSNAVVNRLGFANPADGAQAMDAEGKIVDRNTTGFALWIAPLWQSQHGWGMEADNLDYGFNGNLGGVSLGADYTFENAIRAGITFNIGGGYAESSGGDLNSTENRMSFWGLGAYAGWNYENFGLMADVSYTSTWNDLQQDMDSRMGMGDLEADVQASAISAGLRAEYKLETSVLDVIPHIGVRYMSLNTWGFDAESNGGTVLEGDGFHQDIWTFPVGVTFTKDFTLDSGWSFKPSVDFSVIPAAGDIKAKQDVAFTGLPGSYEVETQMMDYLTWQGGVGLEMGNDTMSFGVNYTLQAGQHTTGHGVFGSFRYEF